MSHNGSVRGFALLIVIVLGCGRESVAPEEVTSTSARALTISGGVPEEAIRLGTITAEANAAPVYSGSIDPPYNVPETVASQQLRQWSLQAQALEAADPDRFYVMRMDTGTGDVFAVARSKADAAAHAKLLAPGGVAAPSAQPSDGLMNKDDIAAISDGVDNRSPVGDSSYDTNWYLMTTGYQQTNSNGILGRCTGSLFASYWVATAAHCTIPAGGNAPGLNAITFVPRMRDNGNAPYGSATTTAIEWEIAYTANNCQNHFADNSICLYYDLSLVHFATGLIYSAYNGFESATDSSFTNSYNRTAGYPKCYPVNNCETFVPYQDNYCASRHPQTYGASSSNSWPYNDGSSPAYRAGCDISGGQSGSALLDQSNNYIMGVFSSAACSGTNCAYATIGPRINSQVFNWMVGHR